MTEKKRAISKEDLNEISKDYGISKKEIVNAIVGKEERVLANIYPRNYEELKEKYKAVNIENIVERKVKYYQLKPFKEQNKLIWIETIKDYLELINEDYVKPEKPIRDPFSIFSIKNQAEEFNETQPIFYDKSKSFWLWNSEEFKWVMSDDVEILNMISSSTGVDVINSKSRTEILNALKQKGRKNAPKEPKGEWVQFKDKIYDVKTGDVFPATSEYFIKNPLPWKVGISEDTPTIDKLLREWVDEEFIDTLLEIIAYSACTERFMQRMIALVGGGSNGKGTFVKLLYKFLGEENITSSELRLISENHFETAVLYGKLVVIFGEVQYDDLRNTNTLKQIAGEDKIRYCFKGKTPFADKNTAMGLCLTNSLPITPDRSIGFYRKWSIIDFPNQFKEVKKDLITIIPDSEFENLSKRCLRILKELYENPKFTNEGDFEERAKRYEERSNPVMRFIEDFCLEEPGENLSLRNFTNVCNQYLKDKHLRVMTASQIGKVIRNEGFSVAKRTMDNVSSVVILNLSLVKLPKLPLLPKSSVKSSSKVIKKISSSGSSGSSQHKKDLNLDQFTDEEIKETGFTREELEEQIK